MSIRVLSQSQDSLLRRHGRTFRFETRSAVSNSVNWLIWSTMPAILGFDVGVAVVDSHLRVGTRLCRWEYTEGAKQTGREGLRRARAQHRVVYEIQTDIVVENEMTGVGQESSVYYPVLRARRYKRNTFR